MNACILLGSSKDYGSNKELEAKELKEILYKLNESMKSDVRQTSIWNTLGILLLKAGRCRKLGPHCKTWNGSSSKVRTSVLDVLIFLSTKCSIVKSPTYLKP